MFGKKDYVIVVVVLLLPVVSGESKYKYYGANEAGEMSIHVRKIQQREKWREKEERALHYSPAPCWLNHVARDENVWYIRRTRCVVSSSDSVC